MSERMMTLGEVADLVGVSPSTIYRRRAMGDDLPPAYKLGAKVMFRRSEVEAWIDEHRDSPTDRVAS